VYELTFDVGLPRSENRLSLPIEHELRRHTAQPLIEITIVIDSVDFTLYGADTLVLVVPTISGGSKNRVMFAIEAQRAGPLQLSAAFFIKDRLFQRHILTFQVGVAAHSADRTNALIQGVTMESAFLLGQHVPGRRVSLLISRSAEDYRLVFQGAGVYRATLNFIEEDLAQWVEYARRELAAIVTPQDPAVPRHYHADTTSIPEEVFHASLRSLAKVGKRLYDNLFFGIRQGSDARALGTVLREISRCERLIVQVAASHFAFPWALIYDGENTETPDWQDFWGFKHIIECLPEFSQPTLRNFDSTIAIVGEIPLGFVCNNQIDADYGPLVATQRERFGDFSGVRLREYPTKGDLLELLADTAAPALIYCYCHAAGFLPREGEYGVDSSYLELTDGRLSLREMKEAVPMEQPPFINAPLVFINACQSLRLSPYLYDGLMPYLVTRGARGVIGTEINTPAPFAAEFATELLHRFTDNAVPIGILLLNLRRAYVRDRRNLLGLLYTLYSSGDVMIQRFAPERA
jgi:hypothetical protein